MPVGQPVLTCPHGRLTPSIAAVHWKGPRARCAGVDGIGGLPAVFGQRHVPEGRRLPGDWPQRRRLRYQFGCPLSDRWLSHHRVSASRGAVFGARAAGGQPPARKQPCPSAGRGLQGSAEGHAHAMPASARHLPHLPCLQGGLIERLRPLWHRPVLEHQWSRVRDRAHHCAVQRARMRVGRGVSATCRRAGVLDARLALALLARCTNMLA